MEQRIAFVELLRTRREGIVFAESCTAGLLAATLAKIPGVSEVLCGSMVVYQTATKTDWLGVDSLMLSDPEVGPVSSATTEALAVAVLARTPRAKWSVAVTGHLGPNAPQGRDGIVYACIARRSSAAKDADSAKVKVAANGKIAAETEVAAAKGNDSAKGNEVHPTERKPSLEVHSARAFTLTQPEPRDSHDVEARTQRLNEAASLVMDWLIATISASV